MLDSFSYRDLVRLRKAQIANFYADEGSHVFPTATALAFICLPVLGLLVPGARRLRLILFTITLYLGVIITRDMRSIHVGNGFMVGLFTSSWILHVAVHTLLSSVEKDFRRLEYRRPADHRRDHPLDVRQIMHWQQYPEAVFHRLNWAVGLLFSWRGVEWNWRIDTLKELPAQLQASLLHPPRHQTRKPLTNDHGLLPLLFSALNSYAMLSLVVFLMKDDPYFWGLLQVRPLPDSPLHVFSQWPLLLRMSRMMLCFAHLKYHLTLEQVVGESFLFIVALAAPVKALTLLPVSFGTPWLFTPLFGSPGVVMDSGLASFWSSFWHQFYRFDVVTFSTTVLSLFPARVRQHCVARRAIRMLLSFFLVGVIHACASYTQPVPTRPIQGVLFFFLLQPLGIIIQIVLIAALPPWVRKSRIGGAANMVYVFLWFLLTSPLVFDDYSTGGLWLSDVFNFPSLCAACYIQGDQ